MLITMVLYNSQKLKKNPGNNRIDKGWHDHTVAYYAALKMNYLLT